MHGHTYLTPRLTGDVFALMAEPPVAEPVALTDRQRQVLAGPACRRQGHSASGGRDHVVAGELVGVPVNQDGDHVRPSHSLSPINCHEIRSAQ